MIDDGSRDGSLEVIKSFGDRIRWASGPNRGGCAARNQGIEMARGEWIQFLDSDDELLPHKINSQVEAVASADIVLSEGGQYSGSGIRKGTLGRPHRNRFFEMACVDLLTVLGPLIKADHLRAVGGFRNGLPRGQERDLFLRLALNGVERAVFVEGESFRVHETPGSVSSNLEKSIDIYEDIFYAIYLQRRVELHDWQILALADAMHQGAVFYVRAKCLAKARRYFKLARAMHPSAGGSEPRKLKWLQSVLGFTVGTRLYHLQQG